MTDVSRRSIVQGSACAVALLHVPSAPAVEAAGLQPPVAPEPPLDLESWFGPNTMANIRRVYGLGLRNAPELHAGMPEMFDAEGRFNPLDPDAFRYTISSREIAG